MRTAGLAHKITNAEWLEVEAEVQFVWSQRQFREAEQRSRLKVARVIAVFIITVMAVAAILGDQLLTKLD